MRSEAESAGSTSAALPEESVIVISDDEAEVTLGLGNSVLLIEEAAAEEESFVREVKAVEVLDEELAITFSRQGNVMPHARYDCPLHPFARAEQEVQMPLESNASACPQCYCYLCDKLASDCPSWSSPPSCHCNAHNKSRYWKGQRDSALAGVLTIFNLDLTEIDAELREGGNKLQTFTGELSAAYAKYLEGKLVSRESVHSCPCVCHRGKQCVPCNKCRFNHADLLVYTYTPVYQLVSEYFNQADQESPKAAAVMLLGAAKELISHKVTPIPFTPNDPTANAKEAIVALMSRIVYSMQRLLVLSEYPKNLFEKFITFFQCLQLPPHCYSFTNSLNVPPWDSLLLMSVLAGQNVTGQRTVKGKKEFLWEPLPVVQSRVKKLEEDKSYRQLVRYLNAVRCPDSMALTALRYKSCFYMCKYGDFANAASSLLQMKGNCMVNILTPSQFELYLTMFRTSSCPPGNEPIAGDIWIRHDGCPLKKGSLVRCAIRVLYANMYLAQEPKCWCALIRTWCTCDTMTMDGKLMAMTLQEPDPMFQRAVLSMSCSILGELQRQAHVVLPDPFQRFPHGAELILIIQVVVQFMMNALRPLNATLELLLAFGRNIWALSLLIETMAPMEILLHDFINRMHKELNEEEPLLVNELQRHGPAYVSQLVEMFLKQRSELVRSVGFHIIDVILHHINRFPWTSKVANYLNTKVPNAQNFNIAELQAWKTKIGSLSSK